LIAEVIFGSAHLHDAFSRLHSKPKLPAAMSLITELKRRNVLRVVSAYAVVGWLILQGAEILFPVYEISDNVIKLIVVCLGIGLIPVVVLSWVFDKEDRPRCHCITGIGSCLFCIG
jgi:hypothetical protein